MSRVTREDRSCEYGHVIDRCRVNLVLVGPGEPPGVDLRLHPVAGLTPASVSSGRLLVRCQTATLGYWGRPDETAELTSGARLRTSDILAGFGGGFRHEGRVDGVMKFDGHWLRPAAAEACLYEHPQWSRPP